MRGNKSMYDEIDEKKEKRNSIILTVMIVITILLILVTIGFFLISKINDDNAEKNAQDIVKEFNDKKLNLGREKEELNNVSTPISIGGTTNNTEVQGKSTRVKMENYDVVGTVRIPKTKVSYPILFPLSKRSLEIATAMLDTQNGINEPGNTTILGHNYRSNLFFSKNHTLKVGDKIYIKDNTGREVEYTIYRGFSTNPNDATYMRRDTKGETEVSLSTCSDDSQKRYVVLARKTSKN